MIFSILIIILLVLGAVQGFRKGLFAQVSGIVSLILAVIFAMYYSQGVTNFVIDLLVKYLDKSLAVSEHYLTYVIVFLCLMLFSSVLFQGIGRYLNKFTQLPIISWGNSVLGVFAGVAIQYFLIFIILNITLASQSGWAKQQYANSELAQAIVKVEPQFDRAK